MAKRKKLPVPNPKGPIEELAAWYWEAHPDFPDRPYIPLYAKDWLGDPEVSGMPLECQGAYVRLLCICVQGPLPKRILFGSEFRTLGVTKTKWKRTFFPLISPRFIDVSDGYVMNRRMLRVFAELEKERTRRRKPGGDPPENPCPPSSSPSSSGDDHLSEDRSSTEMGRARDPDLEVVEHFFRTILCTTERHAAEVSGKGLVERLVELGTTPADVADWAKLFEEAKSIDSIRDPRALIRGHAIRYRNPKDASAPIINRKLGESAQQRAEEQAARVLKRLKNPPRSER